MDLLHAHSESTPAACSWCKRELDPGDCWIARATDGEGEAAFCRLEHIVPWVIRGRGWSEGGATLVRHRAGQELHEQFASVEELAAWAKRGGPWRL
jgi:hypothetical protein